MGAMNVIQPHREKYFGLYWSLADAAATQSVADRAKVGCVIVTRTGMISVGWNGMPPGLPNRCENQWILDEGVPRQKTDPRVIHAERNAIDKMTREGVSTRGAILFTTLSPCMECAKSIATLELDCVYIRDLHDCMQGLLLLTDLGVPWIKVKQ